MHNNAVSVECCGLYADLYNYNNIQYLYIIIIIYNNQPFRHMISMDQQLLSITFSRVFDSSVRLLVDSMLG